MEMTAEYVMVTAKQDKHNKLNIVRFIS